VNDVDELKQFVLVHARSQRIPNHRELLDRIRTDDGAGPGSWVHEWTAAGDRLAREDQWLMAGKHYAMARFPFVDGPGRQKAQEQSVDALNRWRPARAGIERMDVDLPGGRVSCWTAGLTPGSRKPVLLIMGGIVTVKEQWAPLLARIGLLGMAGVVTELPGVGENTLVYDQKSAQMLSGLLDALAGRADVDQTYAMTLSFSGHLALRCAVDDRRIRGVITTGAPIAGFFTDRPWQSGVPQVTVDTLAHLTGSGPAAPWAAMADWALSEDQLGGLDIPLWYVASRRDEIIPPGELDLLRRHVRGLHLIEYDDVHGSPDHTAATQLWCLRALLRMRGGHPFLRGATGVLGQLQRLRR
jgi:esterase FrsA